MPNAIELLAQLLASAGGSEASQILRGASMILGGLKGVSKALGNEPRLTKAINDATRNTSLGELVAGLGNSTIMTPQGPLHISSSSEGGRIVLPNKQELFLPSSQGSRSRFIGSGFGPRNPPGAPPGSPPNEPPRGPNESPSGEPNRQGGIKGAINLQRVTSSNVYAIGYDPETGRLRVQYLAGTSGLHSKEAKARARTKPGAMYDYYNVPSKLWSSFQTASSKGKWVWDNLRIRHTISGHQYDYSLVSGYQSGYTFSSGRLRPQTYIPRLAQGRMASSKPGSRATGKFVKRTMIVGGQTVKSILPNRSFRETSRFTKNNIKVRLKSSVFGRGR